MHKTMQVYRDWLKKSGCLDQVHYQPRTGFSLCAFNRDMKDQAIDARQCKFLGVVHTEKTFKESVHEYL